MEFIFKSANFIDSNKKVMLVLAVMSTTINQIALGI